MFFPSDEEADARLNCPLCAGRGPFTHIAGPIDRRYRLCPGCSMIFMEKEFLPDRAAEIERYKLHQNGPGQPGHTRYLNQAIAPALQYLSSGMRGLDFGCGPTPTLSVMLKEKGLRCENFDPLFFPGLPEGRFDFIFATEVFEHFHNPGLELERLHGLLEPGGILTVMTEAWTSLAGFSEWYYAGDFTHACFWHRRSFEFICKAFGFELLHSDLRRVFILKKSIIIPA